MTVLYLIRHPPTQGGDIIKGHDNLPLVDGWFNNYWRNHALGNHSLSYNNMPPLGVLVLELNGKSAREIPFS